MSPLLIALCASLVAIVGLLFLVMYLFAFAEAQAEVMTAYKLANDSLYAQLVGAYGQLGEPPPPRPPIPPREIGKL